MNYRTYEPDEALNGVIKCYWTLESPKTDHPEKQKIVPDGCMEMIFHYGGLYKQYAIDGTAIIQPRCFVIGQLTRPLEIEATGETGIFAVRFHPDGFSAFSKIPIKKLENTAVALAMLFGTFGSEIEQKILSSSTTQERIAHIEAFLLTVLTQASTIDRVIKSAVDTILIANGQLSISRLSAQANVNRRQLERKFSSIIGLSPKQLSKIIRLQSAIKLMLSKRFKSLTALAYEAEYFDQAHFIKDFKEFTGFTPGEFYGKQSEMSALFSSVN